MIVLGIETSCDETAAAIVDEDHRILANRLVSQVAEHAAHGGVVPEIAARAHLVHLRGLVADALAEAGLGFEDISAIAATAGPGLIGGVFVGLTFAKAMALARNLPFIAVNHLEGHALTARLTSDADDPLAYPYLLLLVSGGHCQLLIVEGVGDYRRLGTTIDDAAGECFDKAAKLMGLGYPGGPRIEAAASRAARRHADPNRFGLPRPMLGRPDCDFSFSGLKTAVRRVVEQQGGPAAMAPETVEDLALGLQTAIGDCLIDRTRRAMAIFRRLHPHGDALIVAGGVAANRHLRDRLAHLAHEQGLYFDAPPPKLCTDNAAMIAWAGLERLRLGLTDGLDFAARPRWPLDATADPRLGGVDGTKGAKA